jgi:hypothetical protein
LKLGENLRLLKKGKLALYVARKLPVLPQSDPFSVMYSRYSCQDGYFFADGAAKDNGTTNTMAGVFTCGIEGKLQMMQGKSCFMHGLPLRENACQIS